MTKLITRRASIFFIAFAALGFFLIGCGGGGDGEPEADAPATETAPVSNSDGADVRVVRVETLGIEASTFDDVIELTGTVEANRDANVSAETNGQLSYIAALGSRVSAGSVIARLDDRLAKASQAAAQAQFDLAETNFKRFESLFADSVITRAEFDNARATRDQVKAALDQSNKMLGDAAVVSPFSGRIEQRFAESGELVMPGTPLVRVVNTTRVKVKSGIPERYAGDVREGATVIGTFDQYGQDQQEGKVTFVSNVIDPSSRTLTVEMDFDNPNGNLKPEMVARVSVIRETVANALVIPQTAIIRDEIGEAVFVVSGDGENRTVSRRAVSMASGYSGKALISKGLTFGEQIVVVGQNTLAEGDHIAVERQYENFDDYRNNNSVAG